MVIIGIALTIYILLDLDIHSNDVTGMLLVPNIYGHVQSHIRHILNRCNAYTITFHAIFTFLAVHRQLCKNVEVPFSYIQ